MKDIIWYDLETLKGFFLFCGKVRDGEKFEFHISIYRNDLYSFIKFIDESNFLWCGYNVLSFDSQIIQFILDNYEKWFDLSNIEIISKIYDFSQRVI